MQKLKHHVFVCTNVREAGNVKGSCVAKGSEEVLAKFKELVKAKGLLTTVRAQKAGCLDVCERGVVVVVYPEAVWYGGVKPEDVGEIVDSHLAQDKPVTRLLIAGK